MAEDGFTAEDASEHIFTASGSQLPAGNVNNLAIKSAVSGKAIQNGMLFGIPRLLSTVLLTPPPPASSFSSPAMSLFRPYRCPRTSRRLQNVCFRTRILDG